MSENYYTMGIQLNEDHVLCSYKTDQGLGGLLDRTGGYGKIEVPLKLAYLKDSGEWLIGEEVSAINFELDFLIEDMLTLCRKNQSIIWADKAYTPQVLMAHFLNEVVHYIYQLNPKAIIKGLRLIFPQDYPQVIGEAIASEVGQLAKTKVELVSSLTSGVTYIRGNTHEEVIWLHLDDDGMTACLVPMNSALSLQRLSIKSDLSLKKLSIQLESKVEKMYTHHIQRPQLTIEERLTLGKMCQTYLPFVFSKYLDHKPLKITFNETYPPFQGTLSWQVLQEMAEPYMETFKGYICDMAKGYESHAFFFTGNGFRLQWTKQVIKQAIKGRSHICWEGLALGLVTEPLLVPFMDIPSNKNKVFGIMVNEGNEERLITLVDQKESLLDLSVSLILMIPKWQETVQLLGGDHSSHLKVMVEEAVPTIGSETLRRVSLTLTFDGEENPQLELDKLAL